MNEVTGVFVAFLVAAVPLALSVTKAVDLVRSLVDPDPLNPRLPKASWIVLAFALGVGLCVGWQFNLMATLAHSIPALANSSHLDGFAGQFLTGLSVGGMSGFWHQKLDQWHSAALVDKSTAITAGSYKVQ